MDMKAAQSDWPRNKGRQPSMFFLTKSHPERVDLAEEAKDLEVKDWLKRNGAEHAVWLSLWDWDKFTFSGDKPERTVMKFIQYTTAEEFFEKAVGLSYNPS